MFDRYFKKNDELDWDYIMSIPEFAALEKCEQSPKWHLEGNALNHTKKCLEWAKDQKIYPYDNVDMKRTYLMCVLFHDIGKSVSTIFKNGDWHAYGHEVTGERIARRILWDEPTFFREIICYCVRYHMEPLNIMGKNKHKTLSTAKMAVDCSPFGSQLVTMLMLTKRADIEGSIATDPSLYEKSVAELNWFELELRNALNIIAPHFTKSVCNVNNRRFVYDVSPVLVDEKNVQTITVLVGLPGAGKDTWCSKNMNNTTRVVCRDDIREELGYTKPGEKAVLSRNKEDIVTELFNKRLKEFVDSGYNVIINNINLRKIYRDAYKAVIGNKPLLWKCVYIEAPTLKDNMERRAGQIQPEVFTSLIDKFDFPRYDEFDEIKIEKKWPY